MVPALLEAGGLEELDEVSGDRKMTALHHALAGDHTDVARVLMLAGADVSLFDSDDRSALHYAIGRGHLQIAGDSVVAMRSNAKDYLGYTHLHLAAADGDEKLVCVLLRRGAGVNVESNSGQGPLHAAVKCHHFLVAKTLLNAGADPNVRYAKTRGSRLLSSPFQVWR